MAEVDGDWAQTAISINLFCMADAGRPLQLSAEAKHALLLRSPQETARILAEKQQWARKMRVMFSPRDMIFEDGNLDPEYVFRLVTLVLHLLSWNKADKGDLMLERLTRNAFLKF